MSHAERLQEEMRRRERAQVAIDDKTRLKEVERQLITGEEHPTQKRLRELTQKYYVAQCRTTGTTTSQK